MTLPDKSILKRAPSLSEQIFHHLCTLIENGTYGPGEQLPSENELSASLEVSRPIVREALSRMKHDGLIISSRGGRARVSVDTSGHSFRLDIPEDDREAFLIHLYELRAITEPEAAALAAQRATDADIESIQDKLLALKRAPFAGRDGSSESLEFHQAVIDASHNPCFAGFISWLGKKLLVLSLDITRDKQERLMFEEIHKEHELIVAAIAKKDPELARKACRYHVILAAKRQGVDIGLPA